MGKQELDIFFRDAGATAPNPFSAEQVFSAVANDAAWERIVCELAFIVSPAAIAQVRRALSGMGSTKKKRLDPQLVAESNAHERACRNAGVMAPFLREGRPVDSSGKEVTPFSMDMLKVVHYVKPKPTGKVSNGRGKGKGSVVKPQELLDAEADKADTRVLRVFKPDSGLGWGFRSDIEWAHANPTAIARFLGDQKRDESGKLVEEVPCPFTLMPAVEEEGTGKVLLPESLRFKISNERKAELKTLKRHSGCKSGLRATPIDFDATRKAAAVPLRSTRMHMHMCHAHRTARQLRRARLACWARWCPC